MKKITYIFVLMTLAACSNDDVINSGGNDEITVDVVSNNAISRTMSGHSHDTSKTYNIESFTLFASIYNSTPFQPYFENVNVSYTDRGWALDKPKFWPDNGKTVDFWAYHNANTAAGSSVGTVQFANGKLSVTDMIIPTTTSEQDDVIYALAQNKSNQGSVPINFRHALSMIDLKFESLSGSNLVVEVNKVTLCGLTVKGSFSIEHDTSTQYSNSSAAYTYSNAIAYTQTKHDGTNEVSTTFDGWDGYYTYCPGVKGAIFGDDILVLPLDFDPGSCNDSGIWSNVYFKISCRIYNIKYDVTFSAVNNKNTPVMIHNGIKGAKDSDGKYAYKGYGSLLYGVAGVDGADDGFADIYVPVPKLSELVEYADGSEATLNGWQAGKRYTYVLSFGGDSHAALDPNGNPIFIPINVAISDIDVWPTASSTSTTI